MNRLQFSVIAQTQLVSHVTEYDFVRPYCVCSALCHTDIGLIEPLVICVLVMDNVQLVLEV